MRLLLGLFLLTLLIGVVAAQQSGSVREAQNYLPGKFVDVTAALGVHFNYLSSHTPKHYLPETMGAGVALFDYDNDGRLDIFLVNGAPLQDPTPKGAVPQKTGPNYWNRLYHQKSDGSFEDVTERAGLQGVGYGMGVAVGDYDNDGFEDLYVTAYGGNKLYHNNGDGTFTDATEKAGVAGSGWSTSAAWVDLDNDGLLDLVITDLANQRYALYQNNRDSTFTYASFTSGVARLTMPHSGWGVRFLDYDNDGWKDLLIAQGHDLDTVELSYPNLHYREPMLLLRNTGKEFVDVSSASGAVFGQPWLGRGMAIGDMDNDGRLDAMVSRNDGPAHIVRNETPTQNHWLLLKLVGHKSNRDAIGAEIKIVTAKGQQFATVSTAGSYLSSSDKRAHFGLGSELLAPSIEIRWPSGILQTLKNVRADQIVQIDEPSSGSPSPRGASPK